jgi:hypothetical protein
MNEAVFVYNTLVKELSMYSMSFYYGQLETLTVDGQYLSLWTHYNKPIRILSRREVEDFLELPITNDKVSYKYIDHFAVVEYFCHADLQ